MGLRVLAVDDSKTMRDMVGFTLRNAGHDVIEAGDGEDALAKLGNDRVDLIITDVNMPRMDGITLIKNLRANDVHKSTPILVLTTESDSSKKNEGRAAGATGWIVKPFSPDKLLQVVSKVCP
ncbi:Chemotaxis protein CheY [Candidatus Terasakiella magnetica]|uniref:Chemotaxis protein CheY n=1 Tax=Candidatus Terasakiella magnetica TaxID=1867952 RepID=A0A1C3RC58_9PROT|nr:response regulator [Candidatus Terasakiella magnetica]SCA54851.1 Chemotaxis protein CheY [Candidatus Terasakiella magnetica]